VKRTTLLIAFVLVAGAAGLVQAGDIVARPENLTFPDLSFEVPDGNAMRFELANGTPVYIIEDHQLPLVDVTVNFRGGRYLVAREMAGLTELISGAWRSGGAGERTAQEFDETLDFLAANLRANIGDVAGSVSLNVMSKDLDEAMGLMMDLMTRPRFQEDRFAKANDDLIQAMKRRNDDTADIERREWDRLIYGDNYWENYLPTTATLDAISIDDCKAMVSELVRSDNIVVAIAGAITREEARALLEKTVGTLPKLEQALPAIPQPSHTPEPGVYVVNKPEVNQGRVRIGQMGYRLGYPREFDLLVGNDILGGGGFTARMMKKIRSDEGLTYGAYSRFSFPITMPGTFAATFQSKSSTCAYATELTFGLIESMRTAPPTEGELTTSKSSFIETFPRTFESPARTANLFAQGELLGRPQGYWQTYRANVRKVTGEAIQNAMNADLHPDKMVVLVVGNIEEIMAGHPDHEARMTDFGEITTLPLRDPLTLEPIAD